MSVKTPSFRIAHHILLVWIVIGITLGAPRLNHSRINESPGAELPKSAIITSKSGLKSHVFNETKQVFDYSSLSDVLSEDKLRTVTKEYSRGEFWYDITYDPVTPPAFAAGSIHVYFRQYNKSSGLLKNDAYKLVNFNLSIQVGVNSGYPAAEVVYSSNGSASNGTELKRSPSDLDYTRFDKTGIQLNNESFIAINIAFTLNFNYTKIHFGKTLLDDVYKDESPRSRHFAYHFVYNCTSPSPDNHYSHFSNTTTNHTIDFGYGIESPKANSGGGVSTPGYDPIVMVASIVVAAAAAARRHHRLTNSKNKR